MKVILIILALILALGLTACSPATGDDSTELVVFAAASLSDVMEEIAELYSDVAPDVQLIFNFASSGTLETQIREGAVADVFISASQYEMDNLEPAFVLDGTRIDLLENKVALVVASENPAGIHSFADMAEALSDGTMLMAMGNRGVPAGRYAQNVLTHFGLDADELSGRGLISYGANVREVAAQVREGSVDCGVVYIADALEMNLTVVDVATVAMSGRVIYPAAVINVGENPDAARAFLEVLASSEAMAIFESRGFLPPTA